MKRLFPLLAICLFAAVVRAEDWPQWRGPRGDGTSREATVPLHWNGETGQRMIWKVPIPGMGYSSPIVHGGTLFLTTCLPDSRQRALLCLDARTGKQRWQRSVITAPLESKHAQNSRASGTPATDGEFVYVSFLEPSGERDGRASPGNVVVAAYDFEGQQRWLTRAGTFSSIHGFCSSPLLFESLVIINGDHDGDSYIVALDRLSGETVWKVPRKHQTRSYVTPLLREIGGQPHLVFSGSKQITSLDPRDGSTWWTIEGPTEQFVASMVYDGEKFYMTAGFPTHHVMGIRPNGRGDVTDTHVAWHSTEAKSYVPSPVVVDRYLLIADDRGIAHCFDTRSGERHWRERLGRHYHASLVTVAGHVFFIDDDGICQVVRVGDRLEIVAENPLGQACFASPAIADERLFIRGVSDLFCFGEKR